jgi:hypothetical protein
MQILPVVTALLSLAHFCTLAVSGNRAELILITTIYPLLSVVHAWKGGRIRSLFSSSASGALLREWTAVLIITSLLLDFLVNVAGFEPNPQARKVFRNLLTLGMLIVPISTVFLSARFRRRINHYAVLLVLFPPAAMTVIPRMGYPSYGLLLVMIGLLSLRHRRIPSVRLLGEAWLLIPFALIPSIWTLFLQAPVQQALELLVVFIAVYLMIPLFKRAGELERATVFLIVFYLPFFVLLLVFPGFYAINSNISSVLLEVLILLCLMAFLYFRPHRWLFLVYAVCCYLLIYRIGSQSSLAATIIGLMAATIIVFMQRFTTEQSPLRKLFRPSFPLGLTAAIIMLMLFLRNPSINQSIFIRNVLWDSVIAALFESPAHFVAGTGNFGYFFYLPQHWSLPVNEAQQLFLSIEPHAINHNPHNDYMLMLYGGGILYLSVFAFFTLRTISQSLKGGIEKQTPILLALMTTLLVHSVTEPLTSTISTSFLFWFFAGLLRKNRQPTVRMPRYLPVLLVSLSIFLISGEIVRIPTQRFWNRHYEIFTLIRSDKPEPASIPDDRSIDDIVNNIAVSRLFFPLDADLIRQQADLRLFQALRSSAEGERDRYAREAAGFYCEAFRHRPVAIHYAGIKRATGFISSPYDCKFSPQYDTLFRRYDPVRHTEKHSF